MNKDQQRRSFDGIVFDSILEMRFYRDVIRPKMASGDIITCQLQKEYVLQPMFTYNGKVVQPITYVADFYLVYKDGREEVIDTKGSPSSTAWQSSTHSLQMKTPGPATRRRTWSAVFPQNEHLGSLIFPSYLVMLYPF